MIYFECDNIVERRHRRLLGHVAASCFVRPLSRFSPFSSFEGRNEGLIGCVCEREERHLRIGS